MPRIEGRPQYISPVTEGSRLSEILPNPDYHKIKRSFFEELQRASLGKRSSLSFIRHPLPTEPVIETGRVQGIVIGGTNFSSSQAEITNGRIEEKKETREEGKVPKFNDRETFLELVSSLIDPGTNAVGLSLAFALGPSMGPYQELDGRLVRATKGHDFDGLLNNGRLIGDEIREYLKRPDLKITVANDTVSLGENALVVGTGLGISFSMLINGVRVPINIEAGNFDLFTATNELEIIDKKQPRIGRFEKMLSGEHLIQHYNLIAEQFGLDPIADSKDLSKLAQQDNPDLARLIARKLLTRSAYLVGTALAAIYEFTGQPITFTADGSIFWKGWKYKEHIEEQLRNLGVPDHAIQFEPYVEDVAMQGALGLLSRTR